MSENPPDIVQETMSAAKNTSVQPLILTSLTPTGQRGLGALATRAYQRPVSAAEERQKAQEEKHQAAIDEAYARGLKEGKMQAEQAGKQIIEQEHAARRKACEHIATQLPAMAKAYQDQLKAIETHATQLALAAAEQVLGTLPDSAATESIIRLIREHLPELVAGPNLRIALSPALLEPVQKAIPQSEDGPTLHFTADPDLNGSECRLSWRGGGLARSQDATWQAIYQLLGITPPPEKPAPGDSEANTSVEPSPQNSTTPSPPEREA